MTVSTLRAVFRTSGAWQFANSYVILIRTNQFQKYQCYHGINHISKEAVQKGVFGPMDRHKKKKTGAPVWRQISTQTQPSPDKECSMEDTVTKPTNIASTEQGVNETDEAEVMLVSPSLTNLNDVLEDSEVAFGDSSTTSVAQNIVGVQDADKVTISKEKHAVSLEVGTFVMRFIQGKDGSTQRGIEDMGVKIKFPRNETGDSIVIEGDSMDDIAKASQKIQSIIYEAAKSPALLYSHFISLPLAIHPELVDKVTKFQSTILGNGDPKDVNETMDENSRAGASGDAGKVGVKLKIKDDMNPVKVDIRSIPIVSYAPKANKSATLYDLRIDGSLFLKPQRLHLTVLMLKLWNKERIHAAMDVLQGIDSKVNEVLGNQPLYVRLKGLDIMKGTKAKAQVLYAPIEEIGDEGRLTRACQIIIDAYVRAGLVFDKDAHQKLKLHATLMNTTFRRGKSPKKDRMHDSFDARGILQQFESEEWGEYHIREAHLSKRFVYDDNEYYHCCASIPFPENTRVLESSAGPAQPELEETPMADSA